MSVWIPLWWRGRPGRTPSVISLCEMPVPLFVAWRERGTNPLSRLRRQLSRRASPWQNQQVSSTPVNGRRSQPISGKLCALAKASPFRERWHGEAVTERVDSGTNPLSRLRRQLSRRGEPLAEPVSFVHTGQRQKKPTDKPINLSPLPKPPPSGEVARRSRDGEGCFRNEPSQSRCARQLSRRGEPLAERAGFVLMGQRQKKSADKPINFSPLPKPPPEWKDFPRPGEDVAARRQKGAVAFRKAK